MLRKYAFQYSIQACPGQSLPMGSPVAKTAAHRLNPLLVTKHTFFALHVTIPT
jgi:hypothetical protein